MDEKELVKFRISPLTATNYYSWANDLEIVLRGKGLWKYVGSRSNQARTDAGADGTQADTISKEAQQGGREESPPSEAERQKQDLALAYIVTAIDSTCKSMVRTLRCPREV